MLYRDEINRRKFALIWGRKLFFGLSWPLSLALGLIHLRSFILPDTTTDWIYLIFTYISHFGVLNLLVYFFLFVPFAHFLPTYYMVRFWSLILVLGINLFILLDAFSFSNYHLHIYSYIFQLFWKFGPVHVVGSESLYRLLVFGILVVAVFVWFWGDSDWKTMQSRFCNPVKSWYLILILCTSLFSMGLFYYGGINTQLSDLFPLNYQSSKDGDLEGQLKFKYPLKPLICVGTDRPNVVLIVIEDWKKDSLNSDSMPYTFHIKNHSAFFRSHLSVSTNVEDGLYSLRYSLPASFKSSSLKKKPVFEQELDRRGYKKVNYRAYDLSAEVDSMGKEPNGPYFATLMLKESSLKTDRIIHQFLVKLQKENLLENTHVLITGGFSAQTTKVPLIWSSPNRKEKVIDHSTTHYDVMPTLMEKIWGCKNSFMVSGLGKSLEFPSKDWTFYSSANELIIFDLKKNGKIHFVEGEILKKDKNTRSDLIFSALKLMARFGKPHEF